MRSCLILLLIGASSVASARGTRPTSLVDLRTLDTACRYRAEVPADTRSPRLELDAAISTANCMAIERTRRLVLTPTPESVAALDRAVAPAIAILDRVIATGIPDYVVLAQDAKADLLDGNATRMLAGLPELSPQLRRDEVGEHQTAVIVVDALIQPWRLRADACRRAIARVVGDHPEIATRDAVMAHVIVRSRLTRGPGVASR